MRDKAGGAEILSLSEVLEVLDDVSGMSVFEGVDKEDEILAYLEEHGGLVKPVMVPFRRQPELHNQKIVKKDVEFFYQVPFLGQLKQLLRCNDVLQCVDNPKPSEKWTYESTLDGLIYKRHPVVLKFGSTTLSINIYHDGVEPVDLGSARVGKHNLTFFYWSLGNIYPEFRSSDKVVQLYVICKTSDLKKYGYDRIMEDFIEGINKLSSDEGVTFDIDGQNRIFHGFLHSCQGDYPAQGAIGGFKEAVSAEKPCRECMASNEEGYISTTSIENFQLRNKNLHESHLKKLEEYNALSHKEKQKRRDPSVEYGVNKRSVLLDIKYFDVTKNMPQDLMHVVHEGILEYTCRLVLRHVIIDKKALPLSLVNERIASLSKAFESDRPGVILEDHLSPTKHLRQSSAQMRVLSLLLPFALQKVNTDGSIVFSGDKEYLDCLICLLQVVQLCLAFKFHIKDVEILRKKIEEFHSKIIALDPTINMGKLHFLHHLIDAIVLYGVIRQVACFRFEGHHAYFKRLIKIMHNFLNPLMTLSVRHQTSKCRQMMKKNFLYEGHECTCKQDVSKAVNRNVNLIKASFPDWQTIVLVSKVKIYGTTFKEGSPILLSDNPPAFAIVKKMYQINGDKFSFICQKAKTKCYDMNLNAYEISHVSTIIAIDVLQLDFIHPIIPLTWQGKKYVLPLGHRSLLVGDI